MDRNIMSALTATLTFCALLHLSQSAPASSHKSAVERSTRDDEMMILSKLIEPIRELSERAGQLETLVAKATNDDDMFSGPGKRQGKAAWDMDYGWGGGRFGKRNELGAGGQGKRYDMYGMSGRFGRDVSRVSQRLSQIGEEVPSNIN